MERGYVKLWRKTLDNGLMRHPVALQLFVWLILNACRLPRQEIMNGVVFELNPGDVLVSLRQLAGQLGLTLQKIRTAITVLENMKILTRKSTRQATRISLVNWDKYQSNQHSDNTGDNTRPTQGQHATGLHLVILTRKKELKKY